MATINLDEVLAMINERAGAVKNQLAALRGQGEKNVNIGDMLQLQFNMNGLTQLVECGTSMQSALHASVMSISRNMKQ
jgi:phospholipase/lecithinase/hemolysin